MEKRALVLGLGVSGRAAFLFLLHKGYKAAGVDAKELIRDDELKEIERLGGEIYTEKTLPKEKEFDFLVVSPGVPDSNCVLKDFLNRKKPVIGEMELGLKHVTQPMVAITGTNGKTTVTALTEHVLKTAGRKAKAVGNIGLALTKYLLNPDPEEILVVELSSYQLDHLKGPFFKAGTILNITPDHLDRYNDFSSYAESKANLQFCLQEDGRLYLPEKVLNEFGHLFHIPLYSFPEGMTRGEGMAEHDFCNAQASFALCQSFGVSFKEFMDGFNSFTKPSHRIQFVKKIGGVSYFDDSKGTNIDATLQAVLSMKGPVILIAGGVDKGASYLAWKQVFTGKVRQIFAIGQAASKISAELSLFFNVKIVDSLENAVLEAAMVATDGDSVLLSPGCSSFDMFRDYAHRGREFQKFVGLLEERELV